MSEELNQQEVTEQKNLETEESIVDGIFGGEEVTIPENGTANNEKSDDGKQDVPENEMSRDWGLGEEDDPISENDSAEKKTEEPAKEKVETVTEQQPKEPEIDNAALQDEIANLNKRLHDTQAAMHNATNERAKLQKELDELKAKQEDEDNWFGANDKKRLEEVEAELKQSEGNLEQLNTEQADIEAQAKLAVWDAAAAVVMKEHADFEHVVYEELVPKIDPEKGDPRVIALWNALPDKSPAAAYKFGKQVNDLLEMQEDPEKYKARIRAEFENEMKAKSSSPTGKDALDVTNSAEFYDGGSGDEKSVVDELF